MIGQFRLVNAVSVERPFGKISQMIFQIGMVSEILDDPGYLFEEILPDVTAAGSGVRY